MGSKTVYTAFHRMVSAIGHGAFGWVIPKGLPNIPGGSSQESFLPSTGWVIPKGLPNIPGGSSQESFLPSTAETNTICAGLDSLMKHLATVPKFFIDPELPPKIFATDWQESMIAMGRSQVLRFPYEEQLIEFDSETGSGDDTTTMRAMIYIRNRSDAEMATDPFPWECTLLGLNSMEYSGKMRDFFILSPFKFFSKFNPEGFPGAEGCESAGFNTRIELQVYTPKWLRKIVQQEEQQQNLIDLNIVNRGLTLLLLILATRGVAKTVVDPVKLNRARIKQDRPTVPKHTVLHIGQVYSRSGTPTGYAPQAKQRGLVRVHWRRGHVRNQPYGFKLGKHKYIYIAPMLVNYTDGSEKPDQTVVVKW